MKINLYGQVGNTKLTSSQGLLPLFEAVINSIQAIEDRQPSRGEIKITIQRTPLPPLFQEPDHAGPPPAEPIQNFLIVDNGIGFNEQNYTSFETAHSRSKVAKGGKGIGRLVWLKAFERAEVESFFPENGKFWRRRFDFTLSDDGVINPVLEEIEPRAQETSVRLVGFKPQYRDKVPRQTAPLARRIVEHCLEYFVMGSAPKILLIDDQTMEQTDLGELFTKEVLDSSMVHDFKVKERDFKITHVQVATGQEVSHRLNFCAHKRTVKTEHLASKIPNLTPSLKDAENGERPFVYYGYVSGPYLDETVSAQRTGFDVVDDGALRTDSDVSWEEMLEGSLGQATSFLTPYTEPVKVAKEERIEHYVHTAAPQFRHLLKHRRQSLDTISPNLPVEKLDVELYRIDQGYQHDMQARYKTLLEANDPKAMEQDAYEKALGEFMEEWNELGMSKLAKHVVHRKATLSFLESRRDLQTNGKYLLEDAVHKIIFPLRTTSDDIPSDKMNLWILDEKLAYHYYLASDKKFTQIEAIKSDSAERPDIIIFNNPFSFADSTAPFQSIVLIEFKRPARNDYDDEENPVTQVFDYVRRLKQSKAFDRKGRPITIAPTTPIYAHIVCDLTLTLQEQAVNAGLKLMPDSHGYFGYNDTLGVYVDIVSFDKLIDDAKRRNAILFEQLGLGGGFNSEKG